MFIVAAIRKNLPGRPDYLWHAQYSSGRTMTFETEQQANEYLQSSLKGPHALYGGMVIHVPTED